MPPVKGSKKVYFSKVREAREALKAKATELIDLQIQIVKSAIAAEQFQSAAMANQWLLDHVAADEDGVRIVDSSIDKPTTINKLQPSINIGFALGGITSQPKALPPAVTIDVEPVELPDIEAVDK